MRIRSIKPEFWRSYQVGRCSVLARLTFAGLWSLADDEGRGPADIELLWGSLHVFQPPGVKANFKRAVSELEAAVDHEGIPLVIIYTVSNERYFWLPRFYRHQHPERPSPSKYPSPPADSEIVRRVLAEMSLLEGKGGEGRGEDRRGLGVKIPPPASASPPKTPEKTPSPTPTGQPSTNGDEPALAEIIKGFDVLALIGTDQQRRQVAAALLSRFGIDGARDLLVKHADAIKGRDILVAQRECFERVKTAPKSAPPTNLTPEQLANGVMRIDSTPAPEKTAKEKLDEQLVMIGGLSPGAARQILGNQFGAAAAFKGEALKALKTKAKESEPEPAKEGGK